MFVQVEGAITSIEVKTKDDKPITELLLAQKGEREQVKIRLNGDREQDFELYQVEQFSGRLMLWTQRSGVGSMVMVSE